MNRILWLALQYEPMAIIGIFDTEDQAIDACTLPVHCVGPLMLNATYEDGPWFEAYYPLAKTED